MKKNRTIYNLRTGIALFFLLAVFPAGYTQGISARMYFDSPEIMIGDQVKFHIEVIKPQGAKVSLPVLGDTLHTKVEILSAFAVDSVLDASEQTVITASYMVTSFDAGVHEIQPLPIAFEFMGHADTLRTGFTSLSVISPEIDESKGIYDIKPPIAMPVTLLEVLPWVLLFFWLLAGVYVLMYFLKRQKKQKKLEEAKRVEIAHEVALKELEKLKSEKLWQSGEVKAYFTKLTDILRKYLENRFGLRAMESTSVEILRDMEVIMHREEKDLELIREILQTADMVKFAKFSPEPSVNENCYDYAVMFVLETKFEEQLPQEVDNDETVKQK
jgi:hypothetical protein